MTPAYSAKKDKWSIIMVATVACSYSGAVWFFFSVLAPTQAALASVALAALIRWVLLRP